MIKELDSSNFKETINSDKLVLVDFNADWCGPCRMMAPILEELAEERKDVVIASLNVDDNDDIAYEYNVSSIPCLIVFKNGEEVKRNIGLISKEDVESLLGE